MSNPNKLHYPRNGIDIGRFKFNPKVAVGVVVALFTLYAIFKYGQFAAERNFDMRNSHGKRVQKIDQLSWTPRVFYHQNFISANELSILMQCATNATGGNKEKRHFMLRAENELFQTIDKRLAKFTQYPTTLFDTPVVSRYEPGYESEPHRDWLTPEETDLRGTRGNQVATFILFLSNASGGEYNFPKANLKVSTRAGDGLLIWNITPDNKNDELAAYGINKVTGSDPLWVMTRYLREKP